jgi:hypothetical protein
MSKLTAQLKETTYSFSRGWWRGEIIVDDDDMYRFLYIYICTSSLIRKWSRTITWACTKYENMYIFHVHLHIHIWTWICDKDVNIFMFMYIYLYICMNLTGTWKWAWRCTLYTYMYIHGVLHELEYEREYVLAHLHLHTWIWTCTTLLQKSGLFKHTTFSQLENVLRQSL